MKIEIKNARIKSTMLGYEDYGIMTFMLYLDYGHSCQGVGGYCLGEEGSSMAVIMEILNIVGVDKWENLTGKHIRVKTTWTKVLEIGNFLEDKWLNFDKFFKESTNEKG